MWKPVAMVLLSCLAGFAPARAATEYSHNGEVNGKNAKLFRFRLVKTDGERSFVTADLDGFLLVNVDADLRPAFEMKIALRDVRRVSLNGEPGDLLMLEVTTDGGTKLDLYAGADFGVAGVARGAAGYQNVRLADGRAIEFDTQAKDNVDSRDYAKWRDELRAKLRVGDASAPASAVKDALAGAQTQYDAGSYSAALKTLQTVENAGALPAQWFYRVGLCHAKLNDSERAVASFNKALARDPDDAGIWLELGRAHYLAREWGGAEKAFQSGLRKKPAETVLLDLSYYLSETFLQERKEANAAAVAEAALEVKKRADLHATAGTAYNRLGKLDAAKKHYFAAVEAGGKSFNLSPVYNNLGGISELEGNALLAYSYYKKALEWDPANAPAKLNFERLQAVVRPSGTGARENDEK